MYNNDVFWFQMRDHWKDLFLVLTRDYKCDFLDFLPKFFNSDFMVSCDHRNPYYTSMFYPDILAELKKENIIIQSVDAPILGLMLSRWVADFYASSTHYAKLEGHVVYEVFPIKTLLSIYPGIHDKPIPRIVEEIVIPSYQNYIESIHMV